MSREQSKQAAIRKAVKSGLIKKTKPRHVPVRLFAPELEVPFHLSIFTPGRGKKVSPQPWLEAAVRSGLAVMGSPSGGKLGPGLLRPLKGNPLKGMKPGDLEELLLKGTMEAMAQIKKDEAK